MTKARSTLVASKNDALIPFATLEFSVPQARRALEAFAQNRFAAWESVAQSAREAIARSIEQLMAVEMALFLGGDDQAGNKRNGYHNVRDYHVKGLGRLELRLPRDRNRSFESVVAPRYERMDPRLREDLALLHLAGISTRTMAMISRHLLGLDVSNKTVASWTCTGKRGSLSQFAEALQFNLRGDLSGCWACGEGSQNSNKKTWP